MAILAMGVPRVTYLRDFRLIANTFRDHIIKVLVVEDFFNTKKWLKDAENAIRVTGNQSTKVALKGSDFDEIREVLQLEPHNVSPAINRIMRAYKLRLTLRHIDNESLCVDVNDIVNEQVTILQSARLLGDEYLVGSLKNSEVVKQKIDEYNELDSFLVDGEKDAKRVIKSIMDYGEIGL